MCSAEAGLYLCGFFFFSGGENILHYFSLSMESEKVRIIQRL